jgi:hypothetical protein
VWGVHDVDGGISATDYGTVRLGSCQAELRLTERLYDVRNMANMSCKIQGAAHIGTSQQETNTDSVTLRSEIDVMIYKARSVVELIGIYVNSYFCQNMNRTFADGKDLLILFLPERNKIV